MYAVIQSGSKQYRISEGDVINVEVLPNAVGDEVELDRVLLISDESGVKVGQPLIKDAKVLTRVEAIEKARKILVWKYRPKQRYRRRRGHRQTYTRLRIEKIVQ